MKSMMNATSAYRLLRQLDEVVPAWMAEHHVPGLSLFLVRDGAVDAGRSFGVRSALEQAPVTCETVFEAASLTKPVFAALAMQMCNEGLLDLDRPVAGFLPASTLPDDERAQRITVRHILSHTTGLPNWRKGGSLRIHFEPGARFSYSGEGFVILGALLEHLTGKPVAQLARERVFIPLSLAHTSLTWSGEESLKLAVGHDAEGRAQAKTPWPAANPAASLHCSARDYARFMAAVMPGGSPGSRLLPRRAAGQMLSPQIPVNSLAPWHDGWPDAEAVPHESVSWGLGWGLQTTSAGSWFWHWGDNGCYRGFALGKPSSGQGVVILTNGRNGQRVIRRILEAIAGSDLPALDWLDFLYGLA